MKFYKLFLLLVVLILLSGCGRDVQFFGMFGEISFTSLPMDMRFDENNIPSIDNIKFTKSVNGYYVLIFDYFSTESNDWKTEKYHCYPNEYDFDEFYGGLTCKHIIPYAGYPI